MPADVGQRGGGADRQPDRRERVPRAVAGPAGWTAVFGFYTPSLRTTGPHPGPGPAAAQPARRARGAGRAGHPRLRDRRDLRRAADPHAETDRQVERRPVNARPATPRARAGCRAGWRSGSLAETHRNEDDIGVLLPLLGLLVGVLRVSSSTSTSASSSVGTRRSRSWPHSTPSSGRSVQSWTGSTTIASSSAGSSSTRSSPCCSPSSGTGWAWTCTSWR